ncbi:MAG: PilZ domain-containing protein [Spirochaetes bacterium]|nr:PilZ domain-containing protein [Spirochaetota bacterium]
MEKRNNVRVPFHVRSVIKHDDKVIEGEVSNLSTGGMLFKTAEKIGVDESVQISIYLYGSSSHLALNITGKVVRSTGGGIALRFTELDLDSFIHLKNIVSRNALDDEKKIKEFREFDVSEQ